MLVGMMHRKKSQSQKCKISYHYGIGQGSCKEHLYHFLKFQLDFFYFIKACKVFFSILKFKKYFKGSNKIEIGKDVLCWTLDH